MDALIFESMIDGVMTAIMNELGLAEMSIRRDTNAPDDQRWALQWYSSKKGKPLYVKAATVGEAVAKAREVLE